MADDPLDERFAIEDAPEDALRSVLGSEPRNFTIAVLVEPLWFVSASTTASRTGPARSSIRVQLRVVGGRDRRLGQETLA
jgi:hypothetical protein